MVVGQQFKNSFLHIFQNYFTQFLNILFIYLLTANLSIEEVGLYGLCRSILAILEFSNLGTRFGLDFVLPFLNKNSNQYTNSTLSLNFWISFIVILIIPFFYKNFNILIYGIGSMFFLTFNLVRLVNRAKGNTTIFIKQSFLHNSVPLLFQILGLFVYGFRGVVIGFLLGSIFNLFISKVNFFDFISYKPKPNVILNLISKGRGLFILSFLTIAVVSIDRIFIDYFYGPKFNGLYTFLTLVLSSFAILPNSITELAINKIVKNVKNVKNSNYILLLNSLVISSTSLILLAILYFLMNYILTILFPDYLLIENEIKIALIYILPFGLLGILQYNLIAQKKHNVVIFSNILGAVLYYIILVYIGTYYSSESALLFLTYNKIIYAFFMLFLLLFFYLRTQLKLNK